MRITIEFEEDDVLPCVCKIKPVMTAFAGATVVIDPKHVGLVFGQKLLRARVPIEIGDSRGDQ